MILDCLLKIYYWEKNKIFKFILFNNLGSIRKVVGSILGLLVGIVYVGFVFFFVIIVSSLF